MLKIKEIFYSIQGEGRYAGTPCIFVRFSGCNLWSGKLVDKSNSVCYFCDTDFVGGNYYTEDQLAEEIVKLWPNQNINPRIIFTGGEPTLQLTNTVLDEIQNKFLKFDLKCDFAVETNGEKDIVYNHEIWITMSPKTLNYKRKKCNELKVLYPLNIDPQKFENIHSDYKYLQPIYDENYSNNLINNENFF